MLNPIEVSSKRQLERKIQPPVESSDTLVSDLVSLLVFRSSVTDRPKRPPFPNAPLVLTVLEVRYPELADAIGPRAQQSMREALRSWLPLVENVTHEQVQVALGAPMPASIQRRTFPRFVSRDRTTALVINESALVLETTAYEGWEENFRPMVDDVVTALQEIQPPDGVLRIGLRYIDEIRVPSITEVPGDWRDYIDDHLLAAADPAFIPASLLPAIWQGVVQYKTSSDSTLTVRYGPQTGHAVDPRGSTHRKNPPDAGPYFLLDSDSSWQADEVPEFNSGLILERCNRLHSPTREFFQIAVTERLRKEIFEVERIAE